MLGAEGVGSAARGRESEVTGLELDDISLDRKTIAFRPNAWRRLKTPGSHRMVRLWPQLEAIMGPYLHFRLMERGAGCCSLSREGAALFHPDFDPDPLRLLMAVRDVETLMERPSLEHRFPLA